jgi:hypothetical protein
MSMIAVSRPFLDFDRQRNDDSGISGSRTLEPKGRSGIAIGRLTILRRAIASGASTWSARFVAALHDSRRKQAAIELAKHRHLIFDSETGISFGMNSTTQRTTSAD